MMDLSKILWALGAFALGLCLGGCIEIGTLLLVVSILFGAYLIVNAIINAGDAVLNALQNIKGSVDAFKKDEDETRRPIGFETNYVEINEE